MATTTARDRSAQAEPPVGTRQRIVETAARVLQHQGYDGMRVKQIARDAQATLGSLYHFFPGGKRELAAAAIRHGDREFAEMLAEALASEDDPAAAVVACADALAQALHASDWRDGCPVTATALETVGREPELEAAVAAAFISWRGLVADKLIGAGYGEADARELAWTVVNTLEGAEVAAQVARSDEPLQIAGRHLARLLASYR